MLLWSQFSGLYPFIETFLVAEIHDEKVSINQTNLYRCQIMRSSSISLLIIFLQLATDVL